MIKDAPNNLARIDMNLLEIPTFWPGKGQRKSFEMTSHARRDGKLQRVKINLSSGKNLPTAQHNKILLSLLEQYRQSGLTDDGQFAFDKGALIDFAGLERSGDSYRLIREALLRYAHMTLECEFAWYDPDKGRHVPMVAAFSLVTEVLVDRETPASKQTNLDEISTEFRPRVRFGNFLVKAINKDKYRKLVDFRILRSLAKSGYAARLYQVAIKRMGKKPSWAISYPKLAELVFPDAAVNKEQRKRQRGELKRANLYLIKKKAFTDIGIKGVGNSTVYTYWKVPRQPGLVAKDAPDRRQVTKILDRALDMISKETDLPTARLIPYLSTQRDYLDIQIDKAVKKVGPHAVIDLIEDTGLAAREGKVKKNVGKYLADLLKRL